MKTIENLLQEYKIRFRDTEKIKEEGYPFEQNFLNKSIQEISINMARNDNGKVYGLINNRERVWATADLKEKPDRWVVEKDESHPMWERFIQIKFI